MNAINLRRLIHVGCRELGLDSDTRHDLQLVATGKASLSDMTEAEMLRVVEALRQRGFKPGFKSGSTGRKSRPAAPRADLRYIHVLWGLLGKAGVLKRPGRDGLNAFVRSRFEKKWGAVPLDIDHLREWEQISDVIDALKDWCRREKIKVEP